MNKKQYCSVAPHLRERNITKEGKRGIGCLLSSNQSKYNYYRVPVGDELVEHYKNRTYQFQIDKNTLQVAVHKESVLNVYFNHFEKMTSYKQAYEEHIKAKLTEEVFTRVVSKGHIYHIDDMVGDIHLSYPNVAKV